MATADSRLALGSSFRLQATAKFFRISELRRIAACEKVAAVCYRINGHEIEFLLVQTRGGRWTFPKGCAEPGLTHAQAAALEAYEEAGVHGRMEEAAFSRYFQGVRSGSKARRRKITVNAHLCQVSRLETPPERKRNPAWFLPEEAKRRLRENRPSGDGLELARVVNRAADRIQSVRGEIDYADALLIDGRSPQRLLRARNR